MNVISLLIAATLGWGAESAVASEARAEPLRLSRSPQLFLDDFLVARMHNLKRQIQRPVRHPANPLIRQDFPWEARTIQVYGTVVYEPSQAKFRCWYLASASPDAQPEYCICYAESSDGIRWTKPFVGSSTIAGFERHNIVIPGGHGLCVMRQDADPNPLARYKGLGGDILAFSSDGINWAVEPFAAAGKNDTGSSFVHWEGEYLAFVRNQATDPNWPGVMRAVALSTSSDFRNWTPKKTILISDGRDGYPWTQFYGLEVTAYYDQLIGLLPLVYLDRLKGNNRVGTIRVQLVVSRDGRDWQRVADRAIFMEPASSADEPVWDSGTIFPSTTMLLHNDEIRIYYTGVDRRHGEGKHAQKGIGLATLPADRFVALVPANDRAEGILETKPLLVSGNRLLVNADVREAGLRVEVLDGAGNVLPGLDRQSCRLLRHDDLRYQVRWSGSGKPGGTGAFVTERPISLRFILREGRLFAFQFVDE